MKDDEEIQKLLSEDVPAAIRIMAHCLSGQMDAIKDLALSIQLMNQGLNKVLNIVLKEKC